MSNASKLSEGVNIQIQPSTNHLNICFYRALKGVKGSVQLYRAYDANLDVVISVDWKEELN